jgi:23S rRNA pseudouridine1911/1915/1917 synthase
MPDLQRLDNALTSKKWSWVFYKPDDCPATLYDALQQGLPHVDPNSWEQRIQIGGVYVNGIVARKNQALPIPCKLEYYEPKISLDELTNRIPRFNQANVLYEDEDSAVVWKPAGLSSMPTKEQQTLNLKIFLEDYYKRKIHMPSRLDTSTCGLVAISLSNRMHNYLQKAFELRTITKRYLARVSGKVPWQAKFLRASIARDASHAILRKVSPNEGKEAVTIFTNLGSASENEITSTALLVRPLTGRTHQIRVHTSYLGYPIVGDNFYGGPEAESLNLISFQLSFWHHLERKHVTVSAPNKFLPEWAVKSTALLKETNL